MEGEARKVSGFTLTLGLQPHDGRSGTGPAASMLLRPHEAFRQLGEVLEEILYDRMRAV
jgi:hypothetical protein